MKGILSAQEEKFDFSFKKLDFLMLRAWEKLLSNLISRRLFFDSKFDENFTIVPLRIFKTLCYFRTLIGAPTWTVPVCSGFQSLESFEWSRFSTVVFFSRSDNKCKSVEV